MALKSKSPTKDKPFRISFASGQKAKAVFIAPNEAAKTVIGQLGFKQPRPAIFVTGGASNMAPEDVAMTERIVEEAISRFAEEHQIAIVDGGTESGIMQMVGEARRKQKYTFPLIGVAPLGKVQYPGFANTQHEAELEDSHSHFVLVEGDQWGDETEMIVALTQAISGFGKQQAVGILVNGGKIARQEVYLASTKDHKMPMLVLEGSGRFADELATAVRTGETSKRILKAILSGGNITLVATQDGPDAMRQHLRKQFGA